MQLGMLLGACAVASLGDYQGYPPAGRGDQLAKTGVDCTLAYFLSLRAIKCRASLVDTRESVSGIGDAA